VLTLTLDWLAMTFKEMTLESKAFLNIYACLDPVVSEAPHNGYDTSDKDANGVVVSWHSVRDEMGRHAVFAGSALRNIFSSGSVSQKQLLLSALDAGASITRLDLAKDATNASIDLDNIWRAIENGANKGNARKTSRMQSNDNGYTIYIGSRQSDRFARIYDKSAQLGGLIDEWKRFEIECKGMVARAVARHLVDNEDWASAFDTIAKGMLDLPQTKDYLAFFTRDSVTVGIPKIEKQTDRERWIIEQCFPAIVKHYQDNRESEAVRLLRQALDLIDRVE
jgi:hypothetical protein